MPLPISLIVIQSVDPVTTATWGTLTAAIAPKISTMGIQADRS